MATTSETHVGTPSPSQPQTPQQQLEFHQAMLDFKVMFPDMDGDVIEAVLRANHGAVDSTIDHLLSMTEDNERQKGTSRSSSPPEYPNPPSYQQAVLDEAEDLIHLGQQKSPRKDDDKSPGRVKAEEQKRKSEEHEHIPTRQMLQNRYEENLLRCSRREDGENSAASALEAQYLEDERVALMLQNEEFMSELRSDREFMSSLEREQNAVVSGAVAAAPSARPSSPMWTKTKLMDEAAFREKLKNMGKSSKRNFSQLANMFTRRKSGARQLLGQAPAPSKDNLLLNAEPLINDESDDEDDGAANKGKYSHFS